MATRKPSSATRHLLLAALVLSGLTCQARDKAPLVGADQQPGGHSPHEPALGDPLPPDPPVVEVNGDPAGGDFDFLAVNYNGVIVPDPHMAVGPDHVAVIDNAQLSFFDKDGTNTLRHEIGGPEGFWKKQGARDFVFDPEVLYDPYSGRFMAVASDCPVQAGRGFYLFAVSAGPDPNGSWHKYRFYSTMSILDSPNIAVDADVVYLTGDGNFGAIPEGKPLDIVMIDKESVLGGEAMRFNRMGIPDHASQALPVTYDESAPAQYMIGHNSGTSNRVRMYAITDPLGTPMLHSVNVRVPNYARAENAPQLGAGVRLTCYTARFWSAVYRNGRLWATHMVNRFRVRQRWYEFDMRGWPTSGQTPILVQSGELDHGGDVRTFHGSIWVDDAGVMSMVYSRSSPDEYPSMERTWRAPTDPPGTTRTPVTVIRSTSPFVLQRWGDYSAVRDDPAVPGRFWAIHEYCFHPEKWRLRVAVYMTAVPARSVPRNDAGNANPMGFQADPPVLGTTWHASVDNTGMDNTAAAVVAYREPAEVFVPAAGGTLLVDVTHPQGELLKLRPRFGTGVVSFSLDLPPDDSLMGKKVYAQGIGLGGNGGVRLHNARDLTIGGF
jgi:hypothetical protein